LARRIAALGPKKSAELAIWRDGAPQTIAVTLGAMPMDKEANAEANAKPEEPSPLAKLGLTLERARGGAEGVAIADVDPNSVAADHGLQAGDVILEAGGKPATRPADVTEAFAAARADGRKSVLLRVKSGDSVRFVALPARAGA
jgi:serine protease Do